MTDVEAPPKAVSYCVRMQFNQWIIRLYADMTVGDCVGTLGPYTSVDEAVAAGEATGLRDGDKG